MPEIFNWTTPFFLQASEAGVAVVLHALHGHTATIALAHFFSLRHSFAVLPSSSGRRAMRARLRCC